MATTKKYKLIRSKRRTIALAIAADASLVVRAPINTPVSYIERLIETKLNWIRQATNRMQSRPMPVKHEFVEGESFLHLGKTYKLRFDKEATKKMEFKNAFIMSTRERKDARSVLIAWYKQEAKKHIAERVEWYAKRSGLSYSAIKITSANRRWGSCSTFGNLSFSWKLIMAPLWVVDYVVVHELAHLEHKNHSPSFWSRVKVMYPSYEKAKVWLKQNEGTLTI